MNFTNFLKTKLFRGKQGSIPTNNLASLARSKDEQEIFGKIGVARTDLNKILERIWMVVADRRQLYLEIEKSLPHPLMGSAVEVYADSATIKSNINNATIWAIAKNKDYQYEIDKLWDILNLEEVIYDWAWTISTYGDLFLDILGEPGVGIVNISDTEHPLHTSRLDYNGNLIGFLNTPLGLRAGDTNQLLSPWSKCHLRLLGAKVRRSFSTQDPSYTEYRVMSMLTPDNRRLSSKYGTSVLNNALTAYKRLKMAEDSLLLARINRSRLRYIYKVAIQDASPAAAADIINQYILELKRENSLNLDTGDFTSKTNIPGEMEDIILPVWNNTNNLTVDKIGGDIDVKYIVDIEEYRNQLATAIRIPLPLLGGYAKEAPPALGDGALANLDIRFSRQCYRIQRALINGVTRLIQIHLAFQKKDPDLNMFEVQMAPVNTLEEQQMRDSLEKGIDVSTKLIEMFKNHLGEDINSLELITYLNTKILKLNDLELNKLISKVQSQIGPFESPKVEETLIKKPVSDSDLKAFTVLDENKWNKNYKGMKIKISEEKGGG